MDCNKCVHINITEREQTELKEDHICQKYNIKLFHNIVGISVRGEHNGKIYPCLKCKEDKYINFKYRK